MSDELAASPVLGARLLVVDDELHVRSALARSLSLLGYRADAAASGSQALEMLELVSYDLMVLDIRMPSLSGVEVMRRVQRLYPGLLVVILTGHATLESAIAAVKSGAVDYLLKPVSVHDIAAVVAEVLRERSAETAASTPTQESPLLCVGPVTLNLERRRVVVGRNAADDLEAAITDSQTALLAYLMQHAGVPITCQELAHSALGYYVSESEAKRIVRPHISRLRKEIEPDPTCIRLIRTVFGKGYLFPTFSESRASQPQDDPNEKENDAAKQKSVR